LSEAGESVLVFEVGPRDGLQNEKRLIPVADKVRLIDQLARCGLRKIEAASFVSPKWVPQMADAAQVIRGIHRRKGVAYTALTPNLQGFERAREAGVDEVAIFASASEGFSQKNINCAIAESLVRYAAVAEAAHAASIPLRGYVSCVTDCPYDGPTPPSSVARVTRALLDLGCYEVSLGDTIGHGTPQTVGAMLDAVLGVARPEQLAGHYHDTMGRALANIEASLERGLRTFDASVGGLGGCPFAPGARGNVATEAVVALLHERGFATGIDLAKLEEIAQFAGTLRSVA
jgi:hydroxymethylglutaryl-CoA lyase